MVGTRLSQQRMIPWPQPTAQTHVSGYGKSELIRSDMLGQEQYNTVQCWPDEDRQLGVQRYSWMQGRRNERRQAGHLSDVCCPVYSGGRAVHPHP